MAAILQMIFSMHYIQRAILYVDSNFTQVLHEQSLN